MTYEEEHGMRAREKIENGLKSNGERCIAEGIIELLEDIREVLLDNRQVTIDGLSKMEAMIHTHDKEMKETAAAFLEKNQPK